MTVRLCCDCRCDWCHKILMEFDQKTGKLRALEECNVMTCGLECEHCCFRSMLYDVPLLKTFEKDQLVDVL